MQSVHPEGPERCNRVDGDENRPVHLRAVVLTSAMAGTSGPLTAVETVIGAHA